MLVLELHDQTLEQKTFQCFGQTLKEQWEIDGTTYGHQCSTYKQQNTAC